MAQNQLIFCDFDGVIRHWDNAELFAREKSIGLESGYTFRHAFVLQQLLPAITGRVQDQLWRQQVQKSMAIEIGEEKAAELLQLWNTSKVSIDLELIAYFQESLPEHKLALVTNATSKLNDDLANCGLSGAFDFVINSSEIGVAKPDLGYYTQAVAVTNANLEQSIFIDDSQKNVTAAEQFGLAAFYFEGSEKLKKEIQLWLETKK